MRPNDKRILMAILALAAIGILYRLMIRPADMIIPVLVLGTVFLLYKFPPGRWRRRGGFRRSPGARPPAPGPRHKARAGRKAKFRVIPGNKKDDPPRQG